VSESDTQAERLLSALALLNLHSLVGCRDDSLFGEYRAWLVARGEMKKDSDGRWSLQGWKSSEDSPRVNV
jgi:hypothetical protein